MYIKQKYLPPSKRKRQPKGWTKAEETELLRLYYDPKGYTQHQIAIMMGRSTASINRRLTLIRNREQ